MLSHYLPGRLITRLARKSSFSYNYYNLTFNSIPSAYALYIVGSFSVKLFYPEMLKFWEIKALL